MLDRNEFRLLINLALRTFEIYELSSALSTSRTTIERWANGTSEPHELGKKLVVKVLSQKLGWDL